MLLTITTTRSPATDLGYLLHKHPDRAQRFALSFGAADVFYPEASAERCTAALLLDVDPIGLVRNRGGPAGEGFSLRQYVNDRPYVASSFLSVAIAQVFGAALGGRCKVRPELLEVEWPLEARLAAVPARGVGARDVAVRDVAGRGVTAPGVPDRGAPSDDAAAQVERAGDGAARDGTALVERLFGPLGYQSETQSLTLDSKFPEWGASPHVTLTLRRTGRVSELLAHLYVLIPVLDNDKHYWVGDDEVDKLFRHGAGWLATHPERELIAQRYLKHQGHLTRAALSRLAEEDQPDPDAESETQARAEEQVEAPINLHTQRLNSVLAVLRAGGARRVLDLGCGEGKLLRLLLQHKQFEQIVGMDVSARVLAICEERLRLERMPAMQRQRIQLIQGALTYRDERLSGFDAATLVEVIEHLDPPRLASFERAVFEFARPRTAVITTPNVEYNVRFESLPAGSFRHRDHRFEWTRAEFEAWGAGIAARFGYAARFLPIGDVDAAVGAPTQMGVFECR